MPLLIIGLGGNIGEPKKTLRAALEKLKLLGSSFKASKLYWTKPISPIPQPVFLNGVASFETDLSPKELFLELQRIERELGKVQKEKNAPRPIDLDLLFYGAETYAKDDLVIPHPRWQERLFVLIPLADLVDEVKVAGKIWNIRELINGFPSNEVQEIYNATCTD